MRGPEGATPLTGRSQERPWSKHREPHVRNVGAEGSSPFTSNGRCGCDHRVGRAVSIETVLSIPIPYRGPTGQRAWGGLCTDRLLGVCIRIRE